MQLKDIFRSLVIPLLISGCVSRQSIHEDIFIDAKYGNDKNPGTFRKPIKTISELNMRLAEKPSNVYFSGNQTYEGCLVLNNINGTEERPFRITSPGRKRARIDGGNSEAIIMNGCGFVIVSDLLLKGNGRKDGSTTNGLSVRNSTDCRLMNLRAEGFQKSGVDLYNCRNIEVRSVKAFNNGFSGINVMGSSRDSSRNIIIIACTAENNPGDPTKLDNHSGNGILVGMSDSVVIERCIATENGWDMPRTGNGPVGIWSWESSHVKILYCISYNNKTSKNAKDGGGFDLDGGVSNSVIQYCISFGNEGAGYGLFQYSGASPWHDNKISYCLSLRDATTTEGAGSVFVWNGSDDPGQLTNCEIIHNLIINSRKPLVSYENASKHKDFTFARNLFIGPHRIAGSDSGSVFRKNVWLGGGKSKRNN
jgi:hypothetical protein